MPAIVGAADLRDACPVSERRQRPHRGEAERRGLTPGKYRGDVVAEGRALADRVLSGGGVGGAVLVRDRRAVAGRPHSRRLDRAHGGIDGDRAAAGLGQRKPVDESGRTVAGGPQDRVRCDRLAGVQHQRVGVRGGDPGAEAQLDPALGQQLGRVTPELRRQLGQDLVP